MRKSARVSLLFLVALSGCGSEDDNARWSAEKIISARMKDPGSVKFGGVYLVEAPPISPHARYVAVCGVVDGKNSYDAYTGGSRFAVLQSFGTAGSKTQDAIWAEIESADRQATVGNSPAERDRTTVFEKVTWNKYCVDEAHPPTYTASPN